MGKIENPVDELISRDFPPESADVKKAQEASEKVLEVSNGDHVCNKVTDVLVPGPKDIIMGRGRRPEGNVGSVMLRAMVQERMEKYEATRRRKKPKIAAKILQRLKAQGCRFVKETDAGGYEICNDSIAHAKIAHTFRHERSKRISKGPGRPQRVHSSSIGDKRNRAEEDVEDEQVEQDDEYGLEQ